MFLNTLYIRDYTGHQAAPGITNFPTSGTILPAHQVPDVKYPDMHFKSSSRHVGKALPILYCWAIVTLLLQLLLLE